MKTSNREKTEGTSDLFGIGIEFGPCGARP